MEGRRIPIFDDRHKRVILNDAGGLPRLYAALVHVDDPDELDEYARFLWWQWQAAHGQFAEAPAEHYSHQMFCEAASWLLDMYEQAGAASSPELLRAASAILRDASASLNDGVTSKVKIVLEGDEAKVINGKVVEEKWTKLPAGARLTQKKTEETFAAAARFEATYPADARPTVTEVAHFLVANFDFEAGREGKEEVLPDDRVRHVESNVRRWRELKREDGRVGDGPYQEAVDAYRRAVHGPIAPRRVSRGGRTKRQ